MSRLRLMYRRGKWQRELQRNKINAAEKPQAAVRVWERIFLEGNPLSYVEPGSILFQRRSARKGMHRQKITGNPISRDKKYKG